MRTGRKLIAFDLDTKALEKYYPTDSWNNAYEVIKRHMTKNGFSWLQGSVYVSDGPMTSTQVTNILDDLISKNDWLNVCMRDCRETNIGREHNKSHLFDKGAKVLTREELNAQKQQEGQGSMNDYMAEISKMRQSGAGMPSKEAEKQKGDRNPHGEDGRS